MKNRSEGHRSKAGDTFSSICCCPVDVQTYNINFWLQHETNKELFFRFDGEEVRAIFTPRYKPMDNVGVMDRLNDLGYEPDARVQSYLDDQFLSVNIPDGRQTFSVNGSNDKITPGISIANSEVGLSSLKIAAFFLRLKCTNGLIVKTQIAASYRHISRKIMDDFSDVMNEVSSQLGRQKEKFKISKDSMVDNPPMTIQSFNREFQLGKQEQEAVYWGYGFEPGNTMFHIVNAYTRGAEFPALSAEVSYRLQQVGEIFWEWCGEWRGPFWDLIPS